MRLDLAHIQRWIEPGSRVLDLGCGNGEFLQLLRDQRQVRGTGIEIGEQEITAAIARGLNIVEQNLDQGLANFPDQSFDTVVMAHALQAVHYPDQVLDEMLRIGREGIVTFPNFAHWRCRLYLGTRGRMPVSKFMPYQWYDTPNIHFCTVKDFEALCEQRTYPHPGPGCRWQYRAATAAGHRLAQPLRHHGDLPHYALIL